MNENSTKFYSVWETAKITGLSEYFLRDRIARGTIPFLRSGAKYLLSIEKLMEALDSEMEGRSDD